MVVGGSWQVLRFEPAQISRLVRPDCGGRGVSHRHELYVQVMSEALGSTELNVVPGQSYGKGVDEQFVDARFFVPFTARCLKE